jgi:acetyl coenzyme A synthetase (ADP forming)-like protein
MTDLTALLTPQTVAVIGASRTPGKVGHEILMNLIDGGFSGTLVPVNPSGEQILGKTCYSSLTEFNGTIDLSIIAIPTPLVLAATQESLRAGAKAICIISAGFKETGAEGANLEKQIAQTCSQHGARLLGPNCLGLINTHHSMNGSFAKHMPEPGAISVISQSGALCTAILDWAASRHLGLAKLISMGNKSDLCETEFLSNFAHDPETKVIVGYLESIKDGPSFIKAAELAAAQKPIIILKSGVTAAGGKAASSHTGSLAGADIAYGSAFRRSGIIRADTFEELFDDAVAFAMQPLPEGRRVAIITNAGGPGIMAADAAELAGLEVCTLDRASATALRKKLPAAASVGNPIDVLGDADPDRYVTAVLAAQDDDQVDAIVVILTPQAMTLPAETARAIAQCSKKKKPILVSFMGGEDVMPGRDELVASNLPDYPSPERAVKVLKAMCDYAEWKKKPLRIITRFAVNHRRVERIIHRDIKSGILQVGEAEAKSILKAYGFNVSPGRLVADSDEAVSFAEKIGYPIAMKISSPDVIHKSDLGGVHLNLSTPNAVRDAFDLMMLRIGKTLPTARLHGAYIEHMALPGREIILGMTRDPQFGPMLMFGLGGIFVEVMKDVTFHIAPITKEEAMQMLEQTKSFSLLKGARGQASVDLNAIATSLQRISQLVTDFPQITEMDINPFIVGPPGSESVVADARITLSAQN